MTHEFNYSARKYYLRTDRVSDTLLRAIDTIARKGVHIPYPYGGDSIVCEADNCRVITQAIVTMQLVAGRNM